MPVSPSHFTEIRTYSQSRKYIMTSVKISEKDAIEALDYRYTACMAIIIVVPS